MPITKPQEVIKHIIHKEVQEGVGEIPVNYGDSIDINTDFNLAFTVHDKQINSKKLIENIASNSKLIPYIKDNTLFFKGINPAPSPELTTTTLPDGTVGDVDIYIDQSDIISYTNKRTAPEKIYTKVKVNYHYDYALKEYIQNTVKNNNKPDTATEYFNIPENQHEAGTLYANSYYGLTKEQELSFDADYIREAAPAEALQEFLLLWHCNQHNVLKLRLPLKYIQLKIGDYIGFDKSINGVKLFGEDYSIEHFYSTNVIRNGQQILPVWMVTSTAKTLTHIDVEMIQMHNCSPNLISSIDLPPVIDSFNLELIHPNSELQESHVDRNNIALTNTEDYKWFRINFTIEAHDPNNDSLSSDISLNDDELLALPGGDGYGGDEDWSWSHIESFGKDHIVDNEDWTGEVLERAVTDEPWYYEIGTQFIEGNASVNLGLDSTSEDWDLWSLWLVDFLTNDDIPSGVYKEIPAGTYIATTGDGTSSTTRPSPAIRIYKDIIPGATDADVTVYYNEHWNLVSLPLEIEDAHYLTIFPDAIEATLYGFDGTTYVQGGIHDNVLQPGKGYWLRFPDAGSVVIEGTYQPTYEIEITEGWNLIAGFGENDISDEDITDPDGIIVWNSLFGFEGTYVDSEDLVPGKGYWLRATADGIILINTYL